MTCRWNEKTVKETRASEEIERLDLAAKAAAVTLLCIITSSAVSFTSEQTRNRESSHGKQVRHDLATF